MLPALDRLEELVFAAQVARSLASVALGYQGVLLARAYLVPVFGPGHVRLFGVHLGSAMAVAIFLALFFVSLLHATAGAAGAQAGGRAPRGVDHRAPGRAAAAGAAFVLTPITWPLNFVVQGVVRLFGVHSTGFHPLIQTPEELRLLMTQPSATGGGGATSRTTSARCCAASSRSARPSSAR